MKMGSALLAGVAYFLAVFALGFVLGILRGAIIAPSLGETTAVALEIPVMLAVSWSLCTRVLKRYRVSDAPLDRLAMGTTAFALLLVAEGGISVFLAGITVDQHLALYRKAPALMGLIAQMAFALFPVLQR